MAVEAEKINETSNTCLCPEAALLVTKQSLTGITVKNKIVLHILYNDQVTEKFDVQNIIYIYLII